MPLFSLPYPIDLIRLHAANPARYPFLLQTLGGTLGWDILFAYPQQHIVQRLGQDGSFLERLDQAWRAEQGAGDGKANWLPFHGGWFVYLGYELLHEIEASVPRRAPQSPWADFPIGFAARVPAAILLDREHDTTYIYTEPEHAALLAPMQHDIAQAQPLGAQPVSANALLQDTPEHYLNGIARIQRYIQQGDVFQVNLARAWNGELQGDAIGLYQALTLSNPAPFGGLANFEGGHIISSSPERLVRVRHGVIETRPIAGTHPRSSDPAQDVQLKAQLLSTTKERAEHIMLVDLERNDLGRVCKPGSVTVPALLDVATYAHVHHLESTVRGELRQGVTPGEVIRALFPGGTITGCPKVRCMQIIRELEQAPRLAYTGSMGYLNHDGSLDLNILIRSFMLQGQKLQFWAGAGIVADSVPERELNETLAKAKGLLRALHGDEF